MRKVNKEILKFFQTSGDLTIEKMNTRRKYRDWKNKKEQIIESLVLFENEATHKGVVNKRKSMWFYMNELKKDKFMKKYIMLW
jgi:hypothetical protein